MPSARRFPPPWTIDEPPASSSVDNAGGAAMKLAPSSSASSDLALPCRISFRREQAMTRPAYFGRALDASRLPRFLEVNFTKASLKAPTLAAHV